MKKSIIKTPLVIILTLVAIILTVYLPISSTLLHLDIGFLNDNVTLAYSIDDYVKATLIFIFIILMLFYVYKNHKAHINRFLKKHFLIIKGFGILYVAILAIVPVLKSSIATYWQITPFHHIFIYLVIIIIFFCVFISSFDETVLNREFHISELLVCFLLSIMGLVLFISLMEAGA